MPISTLPNITNMLGSVQGDALIVQVTADVDEAKLNELRQAEGFDWQKFFYACSNKGKVECLSTSCDRFKVTGFGDPRYPVHLFAQVGDTIGYIDVDRRLIIPEGIQVTKQSGTIQINETIRKIVSLLSFRLPITVYLRWPGSDLDLRITTPSGIVLTPTSPDIAEFYEGYTDEYYVINSEEEGDWIIEVIGVEVEPEGEPYELTVTVGSQFTFPPEPPSDHGSTIPEPGTLILVGFGLLGLLGLGLRRRRKQSR